MKVISEKDVGARRIFLVIKCYLFPMHTDVNLIDNKVVVKENIINFTFDDK